MENKYHVFNRQKNISIIAGSHDYRYLTSFDTFEETKAYIEATSVYDHEYKVIKGVELEWNVEHEEKIIKKTIIKSKTLIDV